MEVYGNFTTIYSHRTFVFMSINQKIWTKFPAATPFVLNVSPESQLQCTVLNCIAKRAGNASLPGLQMHAT